MEKHWVVYMLQCNDTSLYTGITDDLPRRLEAHSTGRGAKYTRGRGPLTLCYLESCESHSHALKREAAIKRLTRPEKLELCRSFAINSGGNDQ